MEVLISFIIGIGLLMLVAGLLKVSGKILSKLLANALIGGLTIFVINIIGSYIGINIELNMISALIVGIFGMFGVLFLLLF